MSISTDPPQAAANNGDEGQHSTENATNDETVASKLSVDTSNSGHQSVDPTAEFSGDLDTNHTIPTQSTLHKIQDYPVLDKHGKTRPFRSLYSGPNVPRRVLVIFIRHFFCGMCQEYIRSVSQSISTDALLQLPLPTSLTVVGCGSPTLISMYQETTQCPFEIYADPTGKLYKELGMVRTLALGSKPEYVRKGMLSLNLSSIGQGLQQVIKGRALKSGAFNQVGGEFLFEPVGDIMSSPAATPTPDGRESKELGDKYEEKRVAWCHRMKNTRDHAEIPELREILGLEKTALLGKNAKRISRAMGERKGTGFSALSATKQYPTAHHPALAVPVAVNGH